MSTATQRQLATLTARLDALAADVAQLMAERRERRGPRDNDDARVVLATADVAGVSRFTARELLAHARIDTLPARTLRAALELADCDSARSLGRLLRRCEGRSIDGVTIQRTAVDRDGIVWQAVRVSEFENPHSGTP